MKFLHALCLATICIANQSYARTTIHVNTTNDENGEYGKGCSLREAITAVNTQETFGGCPRGERFGTNIIALENNTYTLTKGEIVISHDVTILGANVSNTELKDEILWVRPKRTPPSTTVDGNFKRVFNTATDKAVLTLKNIIITHGKADLGGAILAGGLLTIDNTVLSANEATISGGAIYLSGRGATFNATDSTFTKNRADKGAVISMSCVDHLNPIARNVSIGRSSILNNGSSENTSVINGCGQVTFNIDSSTIAQNSAKAIGGIFYFVDNIDSVSSLTLQNVTMVENKIAPTITYGNLGLLALNSTVIAFNDRGCLSVNGSNTLYNGFGYNALQNCSPHTTAEDTLTTDINLDNHPDASLITELHPLANYGGYTDTYLPKTSSKYILNKAAEGVCSRVDQRGSGTSLKALPQHCDIGSVERRVATAVFDPAVVSPSQDASDRITDVDVLADDIPSEYDTTQGNFGKDPVTGKYLIQLIESAGNRCSIIHREDGERPLIRFDNKGITFESPVVCKYTFIDNNGNISNVGEVRFKAINKPPLAIDDTYTLPSGIAQISLNLIANDNDKNDGIYGGLCTDADNVLCDGVYVRITSQPSIGVITAERTGNCPDYSDTNKFKCYGGHITYRANNTSSPFNDKFTYVVYDIDKMASNEATVTIINQTGVNEESNSGSLGLFSLLGLGGLAFYRRFRKLNVG